MGPIGAARVGFINNEYVLNPTLEEMTESQLDLVVAGTNEAVLMVESEAKELAEDVMLGAVMFGHRHFQPVIDAIIKLAEKAAKEPRDHEIADNSALEKEMLGLVEKELREAYAIPAKQERQNAVAAAKAKVMEHYFPGGADNPTYTKLGIAGVFKELEAKIVRWNVLDTKKRIDGRDLSTVRPIVCEVGILPRTHGSALFTRGETQALVVTTLGTGEDEQYIDALQGTYKETFLLHYNFPPYSVGETGRMGGTKRREIGHGKLAWRALHPMLPSKEEFPYTIRVVSEITESNGSSSMATVCGSSLALMDAGVPLKRPTAGIAMGLILEDKRYAVLSDILGDEDHLGDMDFKVAGTEGGITSLQMDIKIAGITEEIMKVALGQAKDGRLHILGEMAKALTAARAELGEHAPRIEMFKIPTDKIREVIGTGGKVIREIVEKTGAKINIEDDGSVKVASADGEFDQGGDQLDQVDRLRSGARPHLRGYRGQGDGLRRFRELLRRQRRAGAYQPAGAAAREQGHRRGQGRRQGEGQAARHGRARQSAPVHESGRPERPARTLKPSRRRKAISRPRPAGCRVDRSASWPGNRVRPLAGPGVNLSRQSAPFCLLCCKAWMPGTSAGMKELTGPSPDIDSAERFPDDLAERGEILLARRRAPPDEADAARRLGLIEAQQFDAVIAHLGVDGDLRHQRHAIAVGDHLHHRRQRSGAQAGGHVAA